MSFVWGVPSNKRTAPPPSTNRPPKKQRQAQRNNRNNTRLPAEEQSPCEAFDAIKLTSVNIDLFNFHIDLKPPFTANNRYMPNNLHRYGLKRHEDSVHAEQALKFCLYTASDQVSKLDMGQMEQHLLYLQMAINPNDRKEDQVSLIQQLLEVFTSNPYLIAQAFGTIANLKSSVANDTAILSPCPFCNFFSSPMRVTCKLVTNLPSTNAHLCTPTAANSKRGTNHFGNRLFNYRRLAQHAINPITEPAFLYDQPDMATIFTALHLFFGYLTTRLRELMPRLTDLLNRPLYPGELMYIGITVEEPVQIDAEFSDEEDILEEEPIQIDADPISNAEDAPPADGVDPLHNPDDPPPPPAVIAAADTTTE